MTDFSIPPHSHFYASAAQLSLCLPAAKQRFEIIDKLLYMYKNSFQNILNCMLMRKFYFKFFHLVHRHKQEGNDIYRYVLNRQHCLAGKVYFLSLRAAAIFKPPRYSSLLQQPQNSLFSVFLAATLRLKDSMVCLAFNKTR